jgi:hypothetical protein
MFQTACGLREKGGWEIAPSEFWKMSPCDWWQIYEINVGYAQQKQAATFDHLLDLHHKLLAKDKENSEHELAN